MEQEEKGVKEREIEKEMKVSYLDYAMSVLVGRALPDARDGLKPVHRRILYAMWRAGLFHNKPSRKSAFIVGRVLAELHPHGDQAVYDALVRLAQDFSLRYPLIQGQGNWGSIDGDNAAAMRYCVTGDSFIVTEKGLVKIKEISNTEEINLKVLSKDKKVNIASRWFDSGEHPALSITTNKGYSLEGSYNHPILALIKSDSGKPLFCWKTLAQIKKGDIVVLDRASDVLWPDEKVELLNYFPKGLSKRVKKRKLPSLLNEDLAYILGALVSEGTVNNKKIEFCSSDESFINDFEGRWSKTFPDSRLHKFKRKPSSYGKKDYYRLECHCIYTIAFLRNISLLPVKSDKKQILPLIVQSPKSVVSSFMRSYFEGDGGISYSHKMIELSCCSRSDPLMKEMQVLLLRFGIDCFRRFDKYRRMHKLYLRGHKNILRFYKEIGFISENKNKKLEYVLLNYKKERSLFDYVPFISDFVRSLYPSEFVVKHNFDRYSNMAQNYLTICESRSIEEGKRLKRLFEYLLTQHYLFEKVISIKKVGIKRVYSIRVNSSCHSFIANGFINHNTEAKLSKLAEEVLQDIDKETVDFVPNFDNSLKEPVVLPSKVPNLLINGSSGIAVGMATNIPPHNFSEVVDALIAQINNPNIDVSGLMQHIKGPDFPTGAIICGKSGIKEAYETGRGIIRVKAKAAIEQKKDHERIIISEIPFQINKAQLIEEIASLVREKVVIGISDLRDESDREGMRIVVELRKDANPRIVLNQLFSHSRLETTFGVSMVALVSNKPQTIGLKQIIHCFIEHRKDVVTKRTKYELRQAEDKNHILQGLIIALENIDSVIKLIKESKEVPEARLSLIKKLSITEKQAQAILDMKLQKLASLEQQRIRDEQKGLTELIKKLKELLGSEQRILEIIKMELAELKEKYGDARRTEIMLEEERALAAEDLIKPEDVIVTISHAGYTKRIPVKTYRQQHKGGKGIIAAGLKEEDFIEHMFIANTHSYILFFTNKGTVHWLKVHEIPEASRQAAGKAIINLLNVPDKEINAFIPVNEFDDKHFLVMITKKGVIKKTNLSAYSRPRKSGIIAVSLDKGDSLIDVQLTDGSKQLLVATKNGLAVRFKEIDIRPVGRSARGVKAIRLKEQDEVIGMVLADETKTLLAVTENGYGKRTEIKDYRLISRGGSGVINIQTTERNGKVVAIKTVAEDDELVFISKKGIIIRLPAKDISIIGRNTQGSRIMRLEKDDKVVAASKIINK